MGDRPPGFCLHFSLSSKGNSNPAYPKPLESITPAINDTSFLLSCPVTGRTQNSPLAISDPINNSEKSLLRPLVEAFLPCVLKTGSARAQSGENRKRTFCKITICWDCKRLHPHFHFLVPVCKKNTICISHWFRGYRGSTVQWCSIS